MTRCNSHYLELTDLITDPPPGAVLCQRCFGWGVLVAWEGWAQSSKDCLACDCNGWIIPNHDPRKHSCKPGNATAGWRDISSAR